VGWSRWQPVKICQPQAGRLAVCEANLPLRRNGATTNRRFAPSCQTTPSPQTGAFLLGGRDDSR